MLCGFGGIGLFLDADVLIGALDGNDPNHDRARTLFTKWRADQDACAISVVNLTEVLIAPSTDASKLAAARAAIVTLGVSVHQPNEAIGVEAARLRASASPTPTASRPQSTRAQRSHRSIGRS